MIGSLYRIDEKALNTLDADTYVKLQAISMALAHAQNTPQELPDDLDSLLNDDDDGDLSFDF